jgi:hypothetical protein|tara:strand:+ start:184 stop:387 length:204 start_codon:yes stop_codon:yes gene_type:complete
MLRNRVSNVKKVFENLVFLRQIVLKICPLNKPFPQISPHPRVPSKNKPPWRLIQGFTVGGYFKEVSL